MKFNNFRIFRNVELFRITFAPKLKFLLWSFKRFGIKPHKFVFVGKEFGVLFSRLERKGVGEFLVNNSGQSAAGRVNENIGDTEVGVREMEELQLLLDIQRENCGDISSNHFSAPL